MKIDFNKALEQLAGAFNTTVDQLYPILIKQAYLAGMQSIVVFVVFLALMIYVTKKALKTKKESSGYWEWLDEGLGYSIILGVLGFTTIISFIIMAETAPTAFINPEYWAIKELLDTITPD